MQAPSTAPPERLRGERLTAGYDGSAVFEDIDFRLADGRVTVLVGPNGSGKSTLLKTLARTLTPERGHVLLDGEDIHRSRTREVARRMGLLPQGPAAPEGLTVRELVCLGRFPYQRFWRQWSDDDERAVHDAMATADVAQFADRSLDDLSGGQRQRCWIAMVLAQETDLILLDEPTTFLDLKVQVDLLNLLVRLAHEGGRTLLLVLHDLNLAAAHADELVMMRAGRIEYSGPPATTFTAGNLRRVFDLDANVIADPNGGRPVCIPKAAAGKPTVAVADEAASS